MNLAELADQHRKSLQHVVIKMGKKDSKWHGIVWYECKDCDWRAEFELAGDEFMYNLKDSV